MAGWDASAVTPEPKSGDNDQGRNERPKWANNEATMLKRLHPRPRHQSDPSCNIEKNIKAVSVLMVVGRDQPDAVDGFSPIKSNGPCAHADFPVLTVAIPTSDQKGPNPENEDDLPCPLEDASDSGSLGHCHVALVSGSHGLPHSGQMPLTLAVRV